MKKNWKRYLGLMTAAAMTFALAACSSGNSNAAEPEAAAEETAAETTGKTAEETAEEAASESAGTIGISLPTNASDRWSTDGRYLQEQFEAAGYKVILKYSDAEKGNQDDEVRSMIADGADLLLIAPVDSGSLTGSMDEAGERGIPVVSYDRLITNTDAVSAYVTFDNYAVGEMQGAFIRDALDLDNASGPFNMELASGSFEDSNAHYVYKGALDVLEPYIDEGQLLVPSGQTGLEQTAVNNWKTEESHSRMKEILASYYADGTVLDAVLCGSDNVALGVTQALSEGYSGGNKPVVTGQDCNIENLRSIVDGTQTMSIYKNFSDEAAAALEVSKAILEGETPDGSLSASLGVEAVFDDETYDNGVMTVPSYLLVPIVITADNLDLLAETGQYKWDADHTYLEAAH